MVSPAVEDLSDSLVDAPRVSPLYSLDNPNPPDFDSFQVASHVSMGTPFNCYAEDPFLFPHPDYPTPSPSSLYFLESSLDPQPPVVSIVDPRPSRVFLLRAFWTFLTICLPSSSSLRICPSLLGMFQGGPIPQPDSPIDVARASISSDTPSIEVVNPEAGAHKQGVKKSNCIKVCNKGSQLILGEGLPMAEVINTANRVLVGQVRGTNYSAPHLRKWILNIWG